MPFPASLVSLLRHQRPLLLQGPMGPFFARLARFLSTRGKEVRKINFNGGDQVFFSSGDPYCGAPEEWPRWLGHYLELHRIDAVVLFGQSRPVHASARQVLLEKGIAVYVFEEGYLRPDYVTLEAGGVNGHSSLPRMAAAYATLDEPLPPAPMPTRQRFSVLSIYAITYLLGMVALRSRYPKHQYHRSMDPVMHMACWIRGGARKVLNRWGDRHVLSHLVDATRAPLWFSFPLQVHNDAQLLHHSPFSEMVAAIEHVLVSFAAAALHEAVLVIKHHPMDRAYTDYRRFILTRAIAHGVEGRVHYVHDLHLPTLLKHAAGVVTINSTVGLQALFHQTPVHALGDTFYAVEGLVHQGSLEAFWTQPGFVDAGLYQRFRANLIRETQINTSLHGRLGELADSPGPDTATDCAEPSGASPVVVARKHLR